MSPRSSSGSVRPAPLRVSLWGPGEVPTTSEVPGQPAESSCPAPWQMLGFPGEGVLACIGMQELGRGRDGCWGDARAGLTLAGTGLSQALDKCLRRRSLHGRAGGEEGRGGSRGFTKAFAVVGVSVRGCEVCLLLPGLVLEGASPCLFLHPRVLPCGQDCEALLYLDTHPHARLSHLFGEVSSRRCSGREPFFNSDFL